MFRTQYSASKTVSVKFLSKLREYACGKLLLCVPFAFPKDDIDHYLQRLHNDESETVVHSEGLKLRPSSPGLSKVSIPKLIPRKTKIRMKYEAAHTRQLLESLSDTAHIKLQADFVTDSQMTMFLSRTERVWAYKPV